MSPAQSGSSAPEPRPKLIYVMGAGRSGSTILGVTLGNCDGIFFAGELAGWLLMDGKPTVRRAERAAFWEGVHEDVAGDAEGLSGATVFESLERSLSLFRVDRWRARRALLRKQQGLTEALIRSIAARSDSAYVVDTSHLPLRARQLSKLDGIDLYLILLVRDIEGIVLSYTRRVEPGEAGRRRRLSLLTVARLWVTFSLSVFVFLRQRRDRRLLVRHEDFVADPERVLGEILDAVGSPATVPDLEALSTGFPLRGNRLLMQETIALRRHTEVPRRRSRLIAFAQWPWSLVFGRLRPAAGASGSRDAAGGVTVR